MSQFNYDYFQDEQAPKNKERKKTKRFFYEIVLATKKNKRGLQEAWVIRDSAHDNEELCYGNGDDFIFENKKIVKDVCESLNKVLGGLK